MGVGTGILWQGACQEAEREYKNTKGQAGVKHVTLLLRWLSSI